MRKIYIIDNGFIDSFTHSHYESLALIKNVKHFDLEPIVFCTTLNNLPPDLIYYRNNFIFHFNKILWRIDNWTNIGPFARQYEKEFIAAISDAKRDDVILVMNASADELLGICFALESNRIENIIHIRVGVNAPIEATNIFLDMLSRLGAYKNVRLHVLNSTVRDMMKEKNIPHHPLGHIQILPYDLMGSVEKKYDFAYFGTAAKVKGFHSLVEAAQILSSINIYPKFLIQHKGAEIHPDAIRALPNITWIPGYLDDITWHKYMLSSRYVVTFYDLDNYAYVQSNQIFEATAMNVGIISSPMPYLKDVFGTEIFNDLCVPNMKIASLVSKIVQKYIEPNYSQSHYKASEISRELISPINFIKKIMESR